MGYENKGLSLIYLFACCQSLCGHQLWGSWILLLCPVQGIHACLRLCSRQVFKSEGPSFWRTASRFVNNHIRPGRFGQRKKLGQHISLVGKKLSWTCNGPNASTEGVVSVRKLQMDCSNSVFCCQPTDSRSRNCFIVPFKKSFEINSCICFLSLIDVRKTLLYNHRKWSYQIYTGLSQNWVFAYSLQLKRWIVMREQLAVLKRSGLNFGKRLLSLKTIWIIEHFQRQLTDLTTHSMPEAPSS